jgi:hypothetical protein
MINLQMRKTFKIRLDKLRKYHDIISLIHIKPIKFLIHPLLLFNLLCNLL